MFLNYVSLPFTWIQWYIVCLTEGTWGRCFNYPHLHAALSPASLMEVHIALHCWYAILSVEMNGFASWILSLTTVWLWCCISKDHWLSLCLSSSILFHSIQFRFIFWQKNWIFYYIAFLRLIIHELYFFYNPVDKKCVWK